MSNIKKHIVLNKQFDKLLKLISFVKGAENCWYTSLHNSFFSLKLNRVWADLRASHLYPVKISSVVAVVVADAAAAADRIITTQHQTFRTSRTVLNKG